MLKTTLLIQTLSPPESRKLWRIICELLIWSSIASLAWAVLPDPLNTERKLAAFCALMATFFMALSILLATRPKFLEGVLDGLDRMYSVHRWSGMMSFVFVLGHFVVVPGPAHSNIPQWQASLGAEIGNIAFYLFIGLITLSFWKALPYHLWKISHQLMGPMFTLSGIHAVIADKPFENTSAAGILTISLITIGTIAWVYKAIFYLKSKTYTYKIRKLKTTNDTITITLETHGKNLLWLPGQFAFLHFEHELLNEPHPFTISCAPNEKGFIRFTIKKLGDFTDHLQEKLTVGDTAIVSGPYGRFNYRRGKDKQVWIAAGIGITPFLAWLHSLRNEKKYPDITFIYSHRDMKKAAHLNEIIRRCNKHGINLKLLDASQGHFLDCNYIDSSLSQQCKNYSFHYCGPSSLRDVLTKGLKHRNVPKSQIHFEQFQMR